MTIIHQSPNVHAELRTCAASAPTLYVGFRNATPAHFESICTLIVNWIRHESTTPFYLHIQHYDGDLIPPDMACLTKIISELSDAKLHIKEKILATCVQAKEMNALVWTAKNLFLKLYQPVKPFDVVVEDEERNAFFRGVSQL